MSSAAPTDRLRTAARGLGQTLVTLAFVLVLFVVYEVWVSNWSTHRAQAEARRTLEQQWSRGEDPLPTGAITTLPTGRGIANLYLPRLGKDYAWTIVEGVSSSNLAVGPGHYPGTALPGQVGNFAVAGHRVGKGEPFLNLDHLRVGDAVIIETASRWYVYRVTGSVTVLPDDGAVLDAVPQQPGARPTQALLTMTTCTPKFSASHRLAVFAVLDPTLTAPRTGETMPASIAALYGLAGG